MGWGGLWWDEEAEGGLEGLGKVGKGREGLGRTGKFGQLNIPVKGRKLHDI